MWRVPRLPTDRPEDDVGSPPVQEDPIAIPRIASGTREDVSAAARTARDLDALASIVHDMKSPLTIISLETRLLEERLGANASVAIQRGLQRIAHNAGYLDRLIMDLLDLGCIEADAFELRLDEIDLARTVAEALDHAVSTLDRPRVQLELFDHPRLVADQMRIERVISNLVGNALKYTPAGTGVTVRLHVGDGRARVEVIDAGPGLDPTEAKHVFDRYRRGGTSRGRPGYGLGLYVSRRIVERHGGAIGVVTGDGKGARFWFELPVR
jgi:signal transduction histidine kinase